MSLEPGTNCLRCGRPIVHEGGAWPEITGLVHPKTLDRLMDRRYTGRRACADCAQKIRHGLAAGVSPDQEALV